MYNHNNTTNHNQHDDDYLVDNDDRIDNDQLHQFQEITAHHRVPPNDPWYKNSVYTVRVLWDTGEVMDDHSICLVKMHQLNVLFMPGDMVY